MSAVMTREFRFREEWGERDSNPHGLSARRF
jgi:hypothetical protein